ncbi:MAG TPA: hypothetical protein VD788_11865 [Candidatus Polarisedimenticolaceae bacterium]|nr:hypothetical protein [Candidatus Polarisedimenticolaceae bacterium]
MTQPAQQPCGRCAEHARDAVGRFVTQPRRGRGESLRRHRVAALAYADASDGSRTLFADGQAVERLRTLIAEGHLAFVRDAYGSART